MAECEVTKKMSIMSNNMLEIINEIKTFNNTRSVHLLRTPILSTEPSIISSTSHRTGHLILICFTFVRLVHIKKK